MRERSKGDESDHKDAIDRVKAVEGRERYQRAKETFYWRMEDIGLQGGERVGLFTPKLDGGRRLWEVGRRSIQTVPISGGHSLQGLEGGGGIGIKPEI